MTPHHLAMDTDDAVTDSMDPEERIAQLEDLVFAIGDVLDTMILVATQTGDDKLQTLIDLAMRRAGLLDPNGSAFSEAE